MTAVAVAPLATSRSRVGVRVPVVFASLVVALVMVAVVSAGSGQLSIPPDQVLGAFARAWNDAVRGVGLGALAVAPGAAMSAVVAKPAEAPKLGSLADVAEKRAGGGDVAWVRGPDFGIGPDVAGDHVPVGDDRTGDAGFFTSAPCVLGGLIVVVAGDEPASVALRCRFRTWGFEQPKDRGVGAAVGRVEPRNDRVGSESFAKVTDPCVERSDVWLVDLGDAVGEECGVPELTSAGP